MAELQLFIITEYSWVFV